MRRLLSGCVAALTLLSATPARADHFPPEALYGSYQCYYYPYGGLTPYGSGFGQIFLDGYDQYYAYANASGGRYKIYLTDDPSINHIHFLDGWLKGWVAEFTVSNNVKAIHFLIRNNPNKGLTLAHRCYRS